MVAPRYCSGLPYYPVEDEGTKCLMSFSLALDGYLRSQRDLFLTMLVEAPRAAPLLAGGAGFVPLDQTAREKRDGLGNKSLVEDYRRLRILSKAWRTSVSHHRHSRICELISMKSRRAKQLAV